MTFSDVCCHCCTAQHKRTKQHRMIVNSEHIIQQLRGTEKTAHEAFMVVYDAFSDRVYSYCRRILHNDTRTLDDIFQNVFVQFYEQARKGTDIRNIGAYLLRIARNMCLNEQSRAGYNVAEFLDEAHSTHGHTYEQKQLLELLWQTIDLLPDDLRDAFVMREELDMSYEEIAEALNITNGTARNKIWRAKAQVRELLQPYLRELNENKE